MEKLNEDLDLETPMKKDAIYTGKIAAAVDPELKRLWDHVTRTLRVDTSTWLRNLLRRELPKLAERAEAKFAQQRPQEERDGPTRLRAAESSQPRG